MNKVLIPVLALAAAGSATFGFIQMNAADHSATERDKLNAKYSGQEEALAKALADRKQALADLESERLNVSRLMAERDEAKKKSKELAEAAQKNAGLASAGASPVNEGREGGRRGDIRNLAQNFFSEMDNNPEVRNALKSRQTEGIAKAYAGIFKNMNLSESDSKLVSELLSDRTTAVLDSSRKLLNGEADEAAQAAVKKEIDASKAEYDTKLKSVLGEEKFAELSTQEQNFSNQRAIDRISRSMEEGNAGLNDQQKTALSDIMKQEKQKLPNNNPVAELGGGLNMLFASGDNTAQRQQEEQLNANFIKRAPEAGLSPDQVSVLQQTMKKQSEDRLLMQGFGRAFRGGTRGARGATGGQ